MRRRNWRTASLVAAWLSAAWFLAGCAPRPITGTVSGVVTLVCPSDVTETSAGVGRAAGSVVPGEIIVRFTDEVRTLPSFVSVRPASTGFPPTGFPSTGVPSATEAFDRARRVTAGAVPGSALYRADGWDAARTVAAAKALARRPDVLYAEPNVWLRSTRRPNDPQASLQWHYDAIELPAAWDVTTGSPDVVLAVVDTGILFDPARPDRSHPDLTGRVLPGYDMIDDPRTAGDGDGRDPNAFDVGDDPCGTSTYHGTHVAGTIGASSDDGVGVAGVDWRAGILPVRALGFGGGTLKDVADGVAWAAGLDVDGVPTNVSHRADVINLSLGGPGACTSYFQEIIDQVHATFPGTVIVAAAGNQGRDLATSPFLPASCDDVIAVGATDRTGGLAWYSNHGDRIDLMAPGGDTTVDELDGVVSLGVDAATGAFGWTWNQGTSMAAPHVTGTIGLIKATWPTVDRAGVMTLLTGTARPLEPGQCVPRDDACGTGSIDAAAAVTEAAASAGVASSDTTSSSAASSVAVSVGAGPRAPGPRHAATDRSFTPPLAASQDAVRLFAVPEGSTLDDGPHTSTSLSALPSAYRLTLPVGRYCLMAWSDENRNGVLDVGDGFGRRSTVVEVTSGVEVAGGTIRWAPGATDLDGACAP